MRGGSLALLALLGGAPALAQAPAPVATPSEDAAALEACVSDAEDAHACIGVLSSGCLGDQAGTVETVTACYDRERAAWQGRLDAALVSLRGDAAAADAVGAAPGPGMAGTVPTAAPAAAPGPRLSALTRAQDAWAAWRAAECAWYAQGFDPEAATVATAECRMRGVAQRVLSLEPQGQAVTGP
ncbi:lysozyme inhibitor LprI family protein [Paracoccus sanguinis]|uniref:lysozyme inhibitor LprI family protein n=1 Tax=Paracoccus sanguinis TaxID=1545044 RepID=UPI000689F91C|nr:lysozyme inhibitor LprI family protein [Paracoccus sanguinis]